MKALHFACSVTFWKPFLASLNFYFDFCKTKRKQLNLFQRVVLGLSKRMHMKASGAMHVKALKNA